MRYNPRKFGSAIKMGRLGVANRVFIGTTLGTILGGLYPIYTAEPNTPIRDVVPDIITYSVIGGLVGDIAVTSLPGAFLYGGTFLAVTIAMKYHNEKSKDELK